MHPRVGQETGARKSEEEGNTWGVSWRDELKKLRNQSPEGYYTSLWRNQLTQRKCALERHYFHEEGHWSASKNQLET